MAIIYSYPTVTPVKEDLILGTDVSAKGNPTKNFTIESIIDLVTIATGDLQFVLDLGNVATGRDINLTNNAFRGSSFITTGGATVSGTTGVGFTNVTSTAFTGTIATAAQPNITSLGALTGLVIDGPISGTNLINNSSLTGAQNDNVVSTLAIKTYVDNKVGLYDTLQEILANGNTTGGSDIVVSAGDDITFTDTSKILMGTTSADNLEIYSDSANSIVIDRSPGALKLQTSLLSVRDEADTIQTISANAAGAVELYHVGDKKIETLVGGAKVTGAFQATTSGTFVDLINTGTYSDSSGDVGTAGQILSSTGTGTNWVTEVPLYNWSLEGTTIPSGTAVTVTDGTNITTTWDAANFDLTIATTGVPDGSGAANQVTYWSDTDTLTGAAGFTFAGGATGKVAIAGELEVGGVLTDGAFTGSSGTYTGYTSITSTDFIGALTGNASTATALASGGAIAITGDTSSTGGPHTYTSGGAVTIPTTIANTTVTSKTLLNLPTPTSTAIAASDSILDAMAKLQGQITGLAGSLAFEGTWNANTDTPTLSGTTPSNGTFYIVSVAGTTDLDGITDWLVGDWAIYVDNGAGTNAWQKLDQSNEVLGSGAANKIAKWTSTNTLATGLIADDGTDVTIGNSGNLIVQGNTTLGDADTDTTSIVGPATMSSTARFNVGISLGNNNYGSAGQALTSGGGSATVNTWTTLDNYQYWVLSDGTNTTNINATDTVTFTGASGITVAESAGTITITGSAQPGTGTQYTLPVWSTTTSLGDSMVSQNAGGTELTVSGNGTFTGNVTVNSDSNAIALKVNGRSSDDIAEINMYENDGTTLLGRIQTRTTEMNIGSITSVPLNLKINNTNALTIESSGNVQLQTVGAQLRFQNSAGAAPYIKNSGEDASTAPYGQNLEFYTGGSKRLTIDSSGNSTFAGNVTSTGFILATNSAPVLEARSTSGTQNSSLILTNIATLVGTAAEGLKLYYSGSTGNTFLDSYYSTGSINFRTKVSSTPITGLSISADGNSTFAGNVGIGVTGTPDNSLHILYNDSTIYSNNTYNAGIQIENENSTTNTFSQLHFRSGNSDSYIRNIREGDNLASLAFLTDNGGATGDVGEVMRLTSSGNVGIGVTPNASYSKLQVKAPSSSYGFDLVGRDAGSNSESQMTFWNSNQTTQLAAIFNTTDNLGFVTGTTERMRITSAGQVNITKGSSGVVLYLDGTNAYDAETGIQLSAGRAKISGFLNTTGGTPGSSLRFYTMPDSGSVTERMRIDSSGNIVTPAVNTNTTITIGVANATSNSFASTKRGNLIVQASSAISGGNSMGGGDLNLNAGNSYSSGGGIAGDVNIRAGYNTLGATTASVKVYTGNAERMLIDSSGTTTMIKTSAGSSTPLVVRNAGSSVVGTESKILLSTVTNDDRGAYISSIITDSSNGNALILATNIAGSGPTERMRITSAGIIEAKANISVYTNMSTVFAGYGDADPGEYGIALNTAGDGLTGSITSNLKYLNGTITQPNPGRSSGEIRFNNTTVASQTADIQFGGYYKGSTTFVSRMNIGVTGRITVPGLDGKTQTGSEVRFNTTSGELYYFTSSKRYKTDIVNLESSLDKINALRPVRFKDKKTGDDTCGLIAEETFEIIPDVVFTKEIEGFDEPQIEGLNYSDLVPFLIKSIQELKADNDNLKARIETLENN